MKLICEVNEDVGCITEEVNGKKNYFIEGIFMQAELQNRNGRIYPLSVMEAAVDNYIAEQVNHNRAVGELGHPPTPTINYDRVSHKIVSLKKEGTNFIGKALILDTPSGKIVKNLMDEGVNFGVSSRGLGSIKQNQKGIMEVQEDFKLATAADIVSNPSGPGCMVGAVFESLDWKWVEGLGWQSYEKENSLIVPKNLNEEMILSAFQKLLKNL
jgi:hypothetical protein